MFCPNCGTQNSETASTCTKCGFNLKGAAAPKFKGTMLMNQSPAGVAPGAPRPMPIPQPMNPGLAGTVVGVPPAGLGMAPSAGAPPGPPAPGGYGAPPPQQQYGAPPPQQQYGAPPPQQQYGAPPPQQQYGAPPPQQQYGAPPPQQQYGAPPPQQGGYAPPGQGGGVNPLGGTMAIDQMPNFASQAPAQQQYGAPPQQPQQQYGAPPQQQPGAFPPPQGGPPGGGFGAPQDQGGYGQQPQQQQYGAPPPQQAGPPGGYGAPPGQQPYGAPPPDQGGYGQQPQQQQYGAPPGQQPYGAPPQQPYGQPGQELAQIGGQASAAMMGALNAQPGARPSQRNPGKTIAISYAVLFGVQIVGGIVLSFVSGALASLAFIFAIIAYGFTVKGMLLETQTAANNQDFKWWFQLVPGLHIYFDVLKIPELITQAKTQAGILQQKPTQGIVLYLLAFPYALATDLNDLAPPGPPA